MLIFSSLLGNVPYVTETGKDKAPCGLIQPTSMQNLALRNGFTSFKLTSLHKRSIDPSRKDVFNKLSISNWNNANAVITTSKKMVALEFEMR